MNDEPIEIVPQEERRVAVVCGHGSRAVVAELLALSAVLGAYSGYAADTLHFPKTKPIHYCGSVSCCVCGTSHKTLYKKSDDEYICKACKENK